MGLTKRDLLEYKWILDSIELLETEIQFFRDKLDLKSPIWSDMPGYKSEGDKMARVISQIVDARENLLNETHKLMIKRSEIECAISKLPEREKVLIRNRYIQGKTWEQICVDMSYSIQRIHQLHSKAIAMINQEM